MAMATCALLTGAAAVASCESPKRDEFADLNDVHAYLKRELTNVRKTVGVSSPKASVHEDNGTFHLYFPIPAGSDSNAVVARFFNGIQELGPLQLHDADGDHISFRYETNAGSLTVQFPSEARASGKFMFFKDKSLSKQELDAFVQAYKQAIAGPRAHSPSTDPIMQFFSNFHGAPMEQHIAGPGNQQAPESGDPTEKLTQLGALVFSPQPVGGKMLTWDALAGYDDVKAEIEDTLLLAIKHPEVYEAIAKETRVDFESNRPKAVLFEGPPGTGKTTSAKIIAAQAGVPMVYVKLENIVTKWYGESEQQLSKIFDACDEMGDCIVFVDEIDALATSRDTGSMHEATRRILSVLLRRLESFESEGKRSIFIAATNRKADLDAALLSRFDISIDFGLPDAESRHEIFARYARQLGESELKQLAIASIGLSGRDIKDVCEQAERHHASLKIRSGNKAVLPDTPDLNLYNRALQARLAHLDTSVVPHRESREEQHVWS